jgi:hypothetical protein
VQWFDRQCGKAPAARLTAWAGASIVIEIGVVCAVAQLGNIDPVKRVVKISYKRIVPYSSIKPETF